MTKQSVEFLVGLNIGVVLLILGGIVEMVKDEIRARKRVKR